MTAFIIIAAILLPIIILLNIPAKLFVTLGDNSLTVTARYLFFRLYLYGDEKKPKQTKKSRSAAKPAKSGAARDKAGEAAENIPNEDETAVGQSDEEKPKPTVTQTKRTKKDVRKRRKKVDKAMKPKRSISDTLDLINELLGLTGKHIRKLLRRIVIDDVKLELLVADDDAFNAAMKYGAINAAVWNFVALLSTIFSVRIKRINITCGFEEKKLQADGSCAVTLRPASALAVAVAIGLKLLYKYKLKKAPDGNAEGQDRKEDAA